jgi:hypothetical protein
VTRLQQLFADQGQSPWLDNLKRSHLRDGRLDPSLWGQLSDAYWIATPTFLVVGTSMASATT